MGWKTAIVFGRNEKGEFVLTDKPGFGAVKYDGKVTMSKGLEDMIVNRNQTMQTLQKQWLVYGIK